jgi:hypothetical protein
MKAYTCPDCGTLLKHYYQRVWDNGRVSDYPAYYCRTCKRTHYQSILDLPIIRRPSAPKASARP